MRKVLYKQKSAYVTGLFLCLTGITVLAVILWKTYPQLSASQSPLLTFSKLLWEENVNTGITELKLIHLFIFGDIVLVLGFTLWLLSHQWLVVPGKTVQYECPFCKKRWKAVGDKALVHCPHCQQLVHPKIAEY